MRAVNRNLPPDRRLRVVAGDGRGSRREQIAADQIRREVLDKNRKALVVFGELHLFRNRPDFLAKISSDWGIVMLLHDDRGPSGSLSKRCMAVFYHQPSQYTRHTGKASLEIRQTVLDMDADALGWSEHSNQFRVRDLADALLYFGTGRP